MKKSKKKNEKIESNAAGITSDELSLLLSSTADNGKEFIALSLHYLIIIFASNR